MVCFFPFPLKDCFTLDSACCLRASETIASPLISFNEETHYVNLKGYITAMNYDKGTIHQCIRNIFIITVQMPQSWSSLESHFQSEQECLRGQVHGVFLAVAGCPSFHIAVFNHAVPSCRNLKLHGKILCLLQALCTLTNIGSEPKERTPLKDACESDIWTWPWRPSLESGTEHIQLSNFSCSLNVLKVLITLKKSPYLTCQDWLTPPFCDRFVLLNQQGPHRFSVITHNKKIKHHKRIITHHKGNSRTRKHLINIA